MNVCNKLLDGIVYGREKCDTRHVNNNCRCIATDVVYSPSASATDVVYSPSASATDVVYIANVDATNVFESNKDK